MRLLWLEVRDFRNHEETSIEVPSGLVAAVGANAQGKTNLLEAANYLLTLTSPRAASDQPLVRRGANSAFLRGEVDTEEGKVLIEVEVRSSGANRIQINRSGVRRKRDLRQRVRSVMFIPEDLAIIQGEPDARRRLMDEAVQSMWPAEEASRTAYDRALRQRNRLLKETEGAPPELEAWDAELARSGAAVTGARGRAVERSGPRAGDEFELVSGEPLRVEYEPSVEGRPDEDLERAMLHRLAERRDDELVRRTTLVGPHRDELQLGVGGMTARRFASHGESWAAALCLRLGVWGATGAEVGEPPVLILDDPFSGLDPVRRSRLAGTLATRGQVLI
ncbi:MAG: DNA replication/repair protein RecF, partial [Actinomycetota bacterium]|nr:DNA replication/repair protein RecF [Actinomycetota bacterium]